MKNICWDSLHDFSFLIGIAVLKERIRDAKPRMISRKPPKTAILFYFKRKNNALAVFGQHYLETNYQHQRGVTKEED